MKADGSSCNRNTESGLDYDRSAEFILDVLRVYAVTGDREFLGEMYPVMLRIVNWLAKQNRDNDILLEGRSVRAPITGVGSCVSVTYIGDAVKNDFKDFGASMFYFQALQQLATAEMILKMDKKASAHLQTAKAIRKAINKIFWDSSINGYAAGINEKGERNNNWITGNNSHAVYCGLTDISQSKVITDFLSANKKELIDVVPCRVSLDTFPAGHSSNPAYYYWNAGCWTLVSAPVMLAYRHVNELESALHVMDVLSSDKVSKTRYGFFESYWSNSGKPNTCEGLLMNNGGVLWGFYEGILGVSFNGDKIIFEKEIPASLLPVEAKFRYRGADIIVDWVALDKSVLLVNNKPVLDSGKFYELKLKPEINETIRIKIGEIPGNHAFK